jgi:hypothetical protein
LDLSVFIVSRAVLSRVVCQVRFESLHVLKLSAPPGALLAETCRKKTKEMMTVFRREEIRELILCNNHNFSRGRPLKSMTSG